MEMRCRLSLNDNNNLLARKSLWVFLTHAMLPMAAVLVILLSFASPALANGKPVKIFLNYLPGISNYGSTSAHGEALVSIGEAWLELKADGLKQLTNGQYEAWLVTVDGQMLSLGKFNAEANGQVSYKAEYDNLPQADYRYFVISVEQEPDAKPEADARRTIAGVIPDVTLKIVSGTPTATLLPGVTPTPAPPSTLPTTGVEGAPNWVPFGLALIIGLGLGGWMAGNGKKRI